MIPTITRLFEMERNSFCSLPHCCSLGLAWTGWGGLASEQKKRRRKRNNIQYINYLVNCSWFCRLGPSRLESTRTRLVCIHHHFKQRVGRPIGRIHRNKLTNRDIAGCRPLAELNASMFVWASGCVVVVPWRIEAMERYWTFWGGKKEFIRL